MARLSSAALQLLLLPGAIAALLVTAATASAQVCADYPLLTGSFAFSAPAARETRTDASDYAFSTRWPLREALALEASGGLSSLTGVHEYRASTGAVFELPVKRFSACAFAGLEHRFTWFDAETAATLNSLGASPFNAGDWYLPVGLAFGYNYTIDDDLSIFAYTQPHYLLWRSRTGSSLAPLRTRPSEALLKGNFAARSGVGVRAGQLLIGVENLFSSAPDASSSGLRLSYLRDKAKTTRAPIAR